MHIQSKNKYIFVLYNIFLTDGSIFSIHKDIFPSLYVQTLYPLFHHCIYKPYIHYLKSESSEPTNCLWYLVDFVLHLGFFVVIYPLFLVGSFTCLPLAAVSVNIVIVGASLGDLFPAYGVVALWDLVVRVCAWKQCVHVYLCWRLWVDLSEVSE